MGNQGTAHPGLPPRGRADPRGRDRRRSARSTSGPTGRSSTGSRRPTSSPGPRRRRRIPQPRPLGPVPRPGPGAAVSTRSITRTTGAAGGTSAPASLGDMACHTANLAFMALKLGLPTRVSAQSGEINSETYPAWATITYEFPARERPAAGEAHLVRRGQGRQAQPAPGRPLPGRLQPLRQRLAASSARRASCTRRATTARSRSSGPRPSSRSSRTPSRSLPRIEGGRDQDDNHKEEWVQAIRAASRRSPCRTSTTRRR